MKRHRRSDPFDLWGDMVVVDAATAPARRRVKANARRLTGPKA